MIGGMASPALLALVLFASLLAMVPVWRLHRAGWSRGTLFTCWLLYAIGIVVGLRVPSAARILLPVLVIGFVAPFVAVPERLTRLLGRRPATRPMKNVTPPTPPGLPGDKDAGGDSASPRDPRP